MKSIDVAGVVVPRQVMDTLAHFVSRLVSESNAENIPWQNAENMNQISEDVYKRQEGKQTNSLYR